MATAGRRLGAADAIAEGFDDVLGFAAFGTWATGKRLIAG